MECYVHVNRIKINGVLKSVVTLPEESCLLYVFLTCGNSKRQRRQREGKTFSIGDDVVMVSTNRMVEMTGVAIATMIFSRETFFDVSSFIDVSYSWRVALTSYFLALLLD